MSAGGYTSHLLTPSTTVVVGRSRTSDIVIDDPSISRRHARLSVSARGTVTITDLESVNGTTVRGRTIRPNRAVALRAGEAAGLGKAIVIVKADELPTSERTLLSREAVRAHIDERCREARANELPFRVAWLTAPEPLTEADLRAAVTPVLGEPDVVGRAEGDDWVLVLDDVPAGRAKVLVRRVSDALRDESIQATIGIAKWPDDGETASALLAAASSQATSSSAKPSIVIGASMEALYADVERIARSDLSVLVLGETGVGKEVIATRLHERSPRAGRPLVKINCSALTPELLESELFGHVRGAFTDAARDKLGLLAAADGGTVFLDEIGDMPLAMQAKLLRVIEDHEIRPIGAITSRSVDLRFVAATNRRLDDPAKFRPDLYFRLSAAVLEIPPLRERSDEILPLARLFLREYADRHRVAVPELSEGSEQVLSTYAWPGNVRELRNLVVRAAIASDGHLIEPHDFPVAEMRATARLTRPSRVAPVSDGPTDVVFSGRQPDRQTIIDVLAAHGGNQMLAAQRLGVHRRTLMRWMDSMNIARPRKG